MNPCMLDILSKSIRKIMIKTKLGEASLQVYLVIFALLFSANQVYAYQSLDESGFFDHFQQYENGQFSYASQSISSLKWQKTQWRKKGLFAAYSPQYPLWSDGADKRRWIYIPKRRKINTNDPNNWKFPPGTKIWKEFSFIENDVRLKVETRLMEKRKDGQWLMETYVWNEAQSKAFLAPEEGVQGFYALGEGKYYDIPSKHDCQYCHQKAGLDIGPTKTEVLGFSALQLSDDRDPDAIHYEPLMPDMLTLTQLNRLRITTAPMSFLPAIPESEYAPLQRRVFGYLHGNCGHCHNESGMAEFTNTLDLSHNATAQYIQQNGVYKTAIAKTITPYLDSGNSPERLIMPGNADASALIYRMTNEMDHYTFTVPSWHHMAGFSVDIDVKMPFVGTNVIDQEAVESIRDYINDLE